MVRRSRNPVAAVKPKTDRRAVSDRRKVTRKGRRGSDPQPVCPSCGLPVARPHRSAKECIAALRGVLERLIDEAPVDEPILPDE